MNRKCIGCGATLQTTDSSKAGFVPLFDDNMKICKRCFRMMHYNELPKIVASNKEYEIVIDDVVKKKALMVFIVDIFSFKSTFTDLMVNRLKDKDVILVANKLDLLPKSSNLNKVVSWIERECQKKNFNPLAIGIASARTLDFIDELISTIDLARRQRDVYFVGCANVGKSSIINALLKRTTSRTDDLIATSLIPGTTLNSIRIPYFEDNCALIDTPGLINESDTLNQILPQSYKKMVPNNEIKPITYQISDGNSICLGGLGFLSFKTKKTISVTVYASRNLYLHRTKTTKLEELIENQLGLLLSPPLKEELDNIKYVKKNFLISNKKDIWFSGFGFVQIIGDTNVTVKYIKNTEVYLTDVIFG